MLADLSKRFRHAAIAIANLTPPRREAQWIKSGLISANPSDDFQHRAGLTRRDITEEEFRAILRTTASKHRRKLTPGARFRQVLIFLWRTGARPAEAAQLKWSNVDLKQRIMVLKQHKTVRTTKRQETRNIPLDPVVVRLLELIKKRNEGERVFVTHRGTPWNTDSLGHRVRKALEVAGLPDDAKLYGVRHAFGTRGIIAGCDLKTLSVLMGHTDTKMTEHYAHIAEMDTVQEQRDLGVILDDVLALHLEPAGTS